MTARNETIGLLQVTIVTTATLLITASSDIVAKPTAVSSTTPYHPITRSAPLFAPHRHAPRPYSRSRAQAPHPPNQTHITAQSALKTTQLKPKSTKVVIAGMQFRPAMMRIKPGEEVTWINHEPVLHAISSPNNGLLASGLLTYGSVFKHTFNEPGLYNYYSTLNRAMMGIVIVE